MKLIHVQVAFTLIAVVGLAFAIRYRKALLASFRSFLLEPSSAFNLGALRIVIFGTLWYVSSRAKPAWFATFPAEVRELPPGWGWAADVLPLDPATLALAHSTLTVTCTATVLGLGTRVMAPLSALLAVYVLGIPNFYFKIDHSAHAPVMCALILACTPCGDALALDRLIARWRGRPAPQLDRVYTLPVRLCWLVLGTVYWFPGLWKLWLSGDLWLSGFQLKGILYKKWGQLGNFVPPFRVDEYPVLLLLLGVMTLVFELGFFFALFSRPARIVAAFAAVSFHLGVLWIMNIRFHAFLPLILLLDFPQIWQWLELHLPMRVRAALQARRPPAGAPSVQVSAAAARTILPVATMGTLILVGQLVTGFGFIDTWPVSLHPTFSDRHDALARTARTTLIVLETATGEEHDLHATLRPMGTARLSKMLRTLSASARDPKALQRYNEVLRDVLEKSGVAVAPGEQVVLYRAQWDLFPLNERANYRRTVVSRFKVQPDGTLKLSQNRREAARAAREAANAARDSDD